MEPTIAPTIAHTPQTQPDQPKRFQCRHIFTDGRRCGSASLRNENFCYYHHTTRPPAADPRARKARRGAFSLPLPEDRSAIQASIGQVLQRIASNDLDPRRAGLLLYGLQIAALNLPKEQPITRPEDERPHEAIVEQIELHPDLGPLAPPAEAPHPRRLTRHHVLESKIREADDMRNKLFQKERDLRDKEHEFSKKQTKVLLMEDELRTLKSAAPPTPQPAYSASPKPAVLPEIKAVAAPDCCRPHRRRQNTQLSSCHPSAQREDLRFSNRRQRPGGNERSPKRTSGPPAPRPTSCPPPRGARP